MSTKLRRQKDIIKRETDVFSNTMTSSYATYLSGSPTYLTFFALAPGLSTQDSELETVHSLVGNSSPNKYYKYNDVAAYNVDTLDISNDLTERGLESTTSADLVFLPNTITPTTSDFFIFDIDGMRDHLFQITEVSFDRATSAKYYKFHAELYKENTEEILRNIVDEYVYEYSDGNGGIAGGLTGNGVGKEGGQGKLIKKSLKDFSESAIKIYDSLVDKFQKIFYDPDMDCFSYRSYDDQKRLVHYWSPYLQKFLYESKIMKRFTSEIMTEFYIQDINSWDFTEFIFSDYAWDECIYKKILTEEAFNFENNFFSISSTNLRDFKTLPFFCSQGNYRMLNFFNGLGSYWLDAAPFKKDTENVETVESAIEKLKVITSEEALSETEKFEVGDIVYEVDKIIPTKIYEVSLNNASKKVFKDYSVENLDDEKVDTIFKIISDYQNNKLLLDENLLKEINLYSFKKNLTNYLLLPILLFILKTEIEKVTESNTKTPLETELNQAPLKF